MEVRYLEHIRRNSADWPNVISMLADNNIKLDDAVEETYGYYKGSQLIGTASTCENTIRSIAVRRAYQGTNTIAEMLGEVMALLYEKGFQNLFIYTKCENAETFKHIGFFEVERVEPDVILLERQPNGIGSYTHYLTAFKVPYDNIGCIVMNANPFTLGHLYLVETAAAACDFLYIFVVAAEHSVFSYEDRYKLIIDGTAHLKNVMVIHGGQYMISDATFPNYFLKNESQSTQIQALLDLKIFSRYFTKALNITKRFIGEEPYCKTTRQYNDTMKALLPEKGVKVIEIQRKTFEGDAISASSVRNLLKQGNVEEASKRVPLSTANFFKTPRGKETIRRIKQSTSRH